MTFWERPAIWFTARIGSFGTEILGGLVLASFTQFIREWQVQALFATTLSVLYEGEVDPNGWSWSDLLQRSVGIAIGIAFWWWVRH